ncbi:MAG: nucleotidyltransferase family protein, partial [Deltaproteobacteria bacterium]|nr:nucleotidyltransferase family protein [Deltaproteobacteria bacterium]
MQARNASARAAEWEVRALLARDLVSRVAAMLGENGIRVVPLKGVLLAAAAPDRPLGRPLTDADVLVGPRELRRAAVSLERGGFRRVAEDAFSVTLAAPGEPLALDLHGELFPAGMFDLDATGVLARARLDRDRFGAPVLWPRGEDAFAHLVGHFVKGRHGPLDRARAEDFERAAARLALEPD